MQGGEGRLNVVHLTAAQASNTGAGSSASAPAPRLPPAPPISLPRESTIQTTHMSMSMARDSPNITVISSPTTASQQTANVNGQYNNTSQNPALQTSSASREYVQYNSMLQSTMPQMSSMSSLGSSRVTPQTTTTPSSQREVPVTERTGGYSSTMDDHHRVVNTKDNPAASLRKRSRMQDENVFIKEGLIRSREEGVKWYQIDIMMQNVHAQIEQALARGDKGKGTTTRLAITESFQELGLEICHLMNANTNLQEENRAAQQQIVKLQNQLLSTANKTYMGALLQPTAATTFPNQSSSIMRIPAPVKHAPADKIIIFRAERKGEKLTKEQQKKFRTDVRRILGEQLMSDIEVIRPTRNGGHILIFQTTSAREHALIVFRNNEINMNIPVERSCIMAPNKRYAKVVCRDPPDDASPDEVMEDFYGKCNMYLGMTTGEQREAKITVTRFGWIFDLSSHEAAAIHAQGNRIRYGLARELTVEEYIPIQQCYNCCMFGHSAKYCQMERPYCRLCGLIGHAGWDCPHKENKVVWKCANCIITNETKGTKYPTNHAAAQLHKCPCALSHKSIRKEQLSAEGIFTYPDSDNIRLLNNDEGPINMNTQNNGNGSQTFGRRRNNRSRSNFQYKALRNQSNRITSSTATSTTMGSSSTTPTADMNVPMGNQGTQERRSYFARTMKPQRPRSFDAWKSGERNDNLNEGTEGVRGREFIYQMYGTNSVTTTQMSDCEAQRPMQMMSPVYDG